MKTEKIPFTGCATALVTPMRAGGVDYPALRKLIEFQLSAGVSALVVCGTTGEAPTLCAEERRRITEFTAKIVSGKIPVIAGCGSPSTSVAAQNAREAEAAGADAVLCVTPYYNKAENIGTYLHYKAVSESVKIPVIAYNVPSRTGLSLSYDTVREISKLPNVRGLKEASGDVGYAEKIVSANGNDIALYSGCDSLIAPIYSVGGKGVISVISNVIPRETVKLCSLCESGALRDASEYQLYLSPLISALFSEVNPIPVKTALSVMGVCALEMRLPLCRMNRYNEEKLRSELRSFGIVK